MKESILEVKNLHFAYDEHHTVLDGISLSVFAGSVSPYLVPTEPENLHFF